MGVSPFFLITIFVIFLSMTILVFFLSPPFWSVFVNFQSILNTRSIILQKLKIAKIIQLFLKGFKALRNFLDFFSEGGGVCISVVGTEPIWLFISKILPNVVMVYLHFLPNVYNFTKISNQAIDWISRPLVNIFVKL